MNLVAVVNYAKVPRGSVKAQKIVQDLLKLTQEEK